MASTNLSRENVRDILNANRPELIDSIKLNIDPILDYLIQDDVISEPVKDRIKAKQLPQDRARELIDHVSSAGYKVYLSFKRGLKETKLDSILEAIEATEREIETPVRNRQHRCQSYPRATVSRCSPEQTTTKQPLRQTKSLLSESSSTVKNLTNLFEGSSAKQDDTGRRKMATSSERCHSSKGSMNVTESSMFSKGFADSSVHVDSEDDLSEETALKQVTGSLNDVEICRHADIPNTQNRRSVNMLLVGCKENGKSCTGNSILCVERFMSKRRGGTNKASLGFGYFQGQYEDIQWDIKVVDTPGISQEMSKSEFEEIVSGVKMLSGEVCSKSLSQKTPGLDAIVLIWSYDHSDRNVEGELQAFESLHRLFGDALYKHLVIVVTHARDLSSIEEYVEELPASLREIERKCSGRLVTFENKSEDVQHSREELCNIVYSLSNGNRHRYTVADLSPMCIIPEGSEIRLALMGKTGVGKSSTGNSILGCERFTISCSASSETSDCGYHQRKEPRKVAVVDCPGALCTDKGVYDKYRLVDQLSRIATIYNTKGVHAMLLVISGRQRFTQEDRDTVQYLRAVFGDRLLQDYTVIVITGRDEIEADKKMGGDVETYLCNAPEDMQEVLKLCNNRVIFFNNKTKDETIQRMQLVELINMIDDLVRRNGGPYIDENFQEGKAVAGNIARSKQCLKAKSTSQLPTTRTSLTSLSFPVERCQSVEGILLQLNEVSPGLLSIEQLHPAKHEVETSDSDEDEASVDEEFTSMEINRSHELLRRQTRSTVSLVEDQLCASGIWVSQESYECRGASAFPLSPRENVLGHNEDSNAANPDVAEERVRRIAAVTNLRLTELWRAIRRKLRYWRKHNSVAPVHQKEGWTG
ncbi:uncharacterized protein [Branchiostoma lanceolatum]|uniref:uncharacterized protein n=1 Tax=Branchiostoma lanceolatum TaxID=7740 RepID=UPI00345685E5